MISVTTRSLRGLLFRIKSWEVNRQGVLASRCYRASPMSKCRDKSARTIMEVSYSFVEKFSIFTYRVRGESF